MFCNPIEVEKTAVKYFKDYLIHFDYTSKNILKRIGAPRKMVVVERNPVCRVEIQCLIR